MTPERWQHIKHLVNSALNEEAETRTTLLQQSCADDFALRLGAEALLSATRPLPDAPLAPDQWQRIEKLFQSALELEPAQRAAFLAQACGNDEALRHEVESLLVYQGAAGGLIQGAVHEAAGLLPNDEKARFTPGTTLNKRYRILGQLGKGGMGEVYRADDLKLGQPVALKFLTAKLSQDKAMLARFHSEVAMAHRVTHPNVCRVHDIGEVTTSAGNLHFLSMEYVDGEDLSSLLRRIGRLPSDKAVEIANQLCAGIAAAHEAGVLHRDLKPANVMIDGKGRVRITDFGLAGFAEQFKGSEVMAGTPAYMSPEQFAGKEVTTKSDIYALGLVLYEVFTGKRVFEAGSLEELKRMHESSAPTTPSSWVKDIDPLVERVILRCLEKDPSKRLASAKQVADALPGGDPLAAALAMGETPSPEMVAAAGSKVGMQPKYAVACLLAIIACLAAVPFLKHKVNMIEGLPMDNSPEALRVKARDISRQFGWVEQPVDTAYGMYGDFQAVSIKESSPAYWEKLAKEQRLPMLFWYREAQTYLLADRFGPDKNDGINQVSVNDPELTRPGMTSMNLDFYGRLSGFSAIPKYFDEPAAKAIEPDWKSVFSVAGFDLNQFKPTESVSVPASAYDVRSAWTGPHPTQPEVQLHIEAAAYRSRVVFFDRYEVSRIETMRENAKQNYQPPVGIRTNVILSSTLYLAVLLVAAWLARRNSRLNKGDGQGAFRVGIFFFFCAMIEYFLLASHVPTFGEFNLIVQALAMSVFVGGISAVIYLALEPYVRRRWPESLIGWQRILAGKWRDPVVGQSVLWGLLAGVALQVLEAFTAMLKIQFGGVPRTYTNSLLGLSDTARLLIENVNRSFTAAGLLFAVFLLCILFRRDWIVCLVLVLLSIVSSSLTSRSFLIVNVSVAIISTIVTFFVARRLGLLALFVFQYCDVLAFLPATTNFSAWYAGYALSVLGVLLTLAIYAFYTSLGGQKVFAGKLLEE